MKNKYDLLWVQEDNVGYIKICGVMQKYIDQSISANTSYNPANMPGGKVSMQTLLTELLLTYKYSLKNLYYMNTNDGSDEVDIESDDKDKNSSVIIPLPPLDDQDDCDSCKI